MFLRCGDFETGFTTLDGLAGTSAFFPDDVPGFEPLADGGINLAFKEIESSLLRLASGFEARATFEALRRAAAAYANRINTILEVLYLIYR